jgi:P-type conjugative transfer protein TrbG
MKTLVLLTITATAGAFAQTAAPVNPFTKAESILRGDDKTTVTPVTPVTHAAVQPRRKTRASTPVQEHEAQPPDFSGVIAKREIVLPASAKVGLALAETIKTTGTPPVSSPDGRILFAYGHSFPVLVCSTFNVCQIELEQGETISKDAIDIGDDRFNIATRLAGSGPQQVNYVIVKPTLPGLDTSLVIGTTARSYYMRLISTDRASMPRVAFSYPDDDARRAKAVEIAQKMEAENRQAEADRQAKLNTPKPLRNRNYSVNVKGKDSEWLRPISIADDGIQHTHIALSTAARSRGLPIVVISDSRGPIPANARWEENTLIVDALFEHACLLSGVGRHQQKACIENGDLK